MLRAFFVVTEFAQYQRVRDHSCLPKAQLGRNMSQSLL